MLNGIIIITTFGRYYCGGAIGKADNSFVTRGMVIQELYLILLFKLFLLHLSIGCDIRLLFHYYFTGIVRF